MKDVDRIRLLIECEVCRVNTHNWVVWGASDVEEPCYFCGNACLVKWLVRPTTKTKPQEIQTTEPCQAQEMLWAADGPQPRACPEQATARYDGSLYCDWHLELLGWARLTGDTDRQ
jgi:hypothetical protein